MQPNPDLSPRHGSSTQLTIFAESGLWPLTAYFLKLGTIGFGGPAALVGFMHRVLVEQRHWIREDTYKLSLARAQIMPGLLAAQTAIAIGYFEAGILRATLVGLAFILSSFVMVLAISLAYVTYGGLWRMQALFYANRCNRHRDHRHRRLQTRAQHQ
jgi:chromate transporter